MGKYREREVISGVDGDSVGFPRCALVATQQDEDKHKAPSIRPTPLLVPTHGSIDII